MQTKLDEAKAELLERAARVAENSPAGRPEDWGQPLADQAAGGSAHEGRSGQDALLAYLQRYYLHTAPEDLADRDPVDLYGAALSHYRLAENRPQGTADVRVHTPTVEENGWTSSHTVVEVVTDDMPFLVDSVTNELSRQGRGIHAVIHPQVVVRRDVTGKLIEVLPDGPATGTERPHDALTESWIHVEIDRESDRDDLRQMTSDLRRVLSDVRETVEDWDKMREAALRIAEELPTEPTADDLRVQEVDEARELLRWLAADHFTFLGYREYQLTDTDSLSAVVGTGLGILRSDPHHSEDDDHPVSPSFSRLPADARAKAREHKLLVLTKANSRATVHRAGHLDYVGVKKFDDKGNVVGERRFLGLFSSAAYTESVRRVPVVRRKVAEVLEGAGLLAEQPRRPRPGADPGDVPPRRAVPDAGRPAPLDRHQRPVSPGAPHGCGCTCARTSTGATTPPSSTCRATGTPPGSGCGWSTSSRRSWAAPASTSPRGTRNRSSPGCILSYGSRRAPRSAS